MLLLLVDLSTVTKDGVMLRDIKTRRKNCIRTQKIAPDLYKNNTFVALLITRNMNGGI